MKAPSSKAQYSQAVGDLLAEEQRIMATYYALEAKESEIRSQIREAMSRPLGEEDASKLQALVAESDALASDSAALLNKVKEIGRRVLEQIERENEEGTR
jgi:hypothetical protein